MMDVVIKRTIYNIVKCLVPWMAVIGFLIIYSLFIGNPFHDVDACLEIPGAAFHIVISGILVLCTYGAWWATSTILSGWWRKKYAEASDQIYKEKHSLPLDSSWTIRECLGFLPLIFERLKRSNDKEDNDAL